MGLFDWFRKSEKPPSAVPAQAAPAATTPPRPPSAPRATAPGPAAISPLPAPSLAAPPATGPLPAPPASNTGRPADPPHRPAPPPSPSPPAPPNLAWASRPVFISSTFRDLQAERSHLRDHVFPRLEEQLRQRHMHLEPIDLRLGVDTAAARDEAERELLVLKVCLDEIKRSRPFLLVLLGERYGWVPPEDRMAAAAREQGFSTPVAGKSVTALEIEYGLFKEDPAQRQRSVFFIRQPLDLEQIPEPLRADYSDAASPDPAVRAGHARLQALKADLRSSPEYAPRVFDYSARWDSTANVVTGLQAFGELVADQVWALLDAETRERSATAPATWQQQESAELAEFVEHRARLLVGRAALQAELLQFIDDPAPQAPWAACITGVPGLGKSAVFAGLLRALQTRAAEAPNTAPIVLANAAGGSTRGATVDSMLRRFIDELDRALGFTTEIPSPATDEQVEALFHAALRRADAAGQHVVVLLDALDQFETSTRGQHLTWLRRAAWPSSTRLVATAQPGTPAQVLQAQPGVRAIALSPLTLQDARELGPQIWLHYHRQLNPDVLAVLTAKTTEGALACGNPLWLTLALEQLNLLDADDFIRAEREFQGTPDQRLLAMVLDTASRMPPDIAGLYQWLLAHAERVHGKAWTTGFALAIALSRQGWRDIDLMDLVPRLARATHPGEQVPDLDELGLATLRRAFRAHVVRRGALQQLDFFHAQMRQAVLQRYAEEEALRRPLHGAISDYLETLQGNDPLLPVERMWQLIGEHDALRAASHYATEDALQSSPLEHSGSTWTLVEWLNAAPDAGERAARDRWLSSWPAEPTLAPQQRYVLAHNFMFGLAGNMAPLLTLSTCMALVQAAQGAMQSLVQMEADNNDWQRYLSVSHDKIGDILQAQGDLAGALAAFGKGQETAERLARADPSNAQWQRDLMVSYARLAQVAEPTDPAGALTWWRKAFEQLDGMQRRGMMNPSDQGRLDFLREKVGGNIDGSMRQDRSVDGGAVGSPHAAPVPTSAAAPRVGRNDPCPCGSGLKFKNCHGKLG